MRLAKIAAAVVAVSITAAPSLASAYTSGSLGNMVNSDGSAKLNNGAWRFGPDPNVVSAFFYSGSLVDGKSDGDWVYTRGKVDGFDWAGGTSAENHNGYGSSVDVSQKITGTDPPAQGKVQLCRHRGGLYPNICVESPWKYSH